MKTHNKIYVMAYFNFLTGKPELIRVESDSVENAERKALESKGWDSHDLLQDVCWTKPVELEALK